VPAISGTDLAPTQARFGVMRFGAFRFGDYYPTLILSLNASNKARYLQVDTLEIDDEPHGQARFEVREGAAPVVGQAVIIALGTAADYTRLFAGSIVRVQQLQTVQGQEVTFAVTARTYDWLLDRRVVSATYQDTTATAIAINLIEDFTTGSFTTVHVQPDLPAVDWFPVVNVRPSTALTRLANLVGAKWYLDEYQDLHFFTDESASIPNPPDLTASNTKFWNFRVDRDLSQVRTRVIVEGRKTTCPIAVPAGATSFPIADALALLPGAADGLRLGTERITYSSPSINSPESYAEFGIVAQSTTVYEAANATAGSVKVENGSLAFATPGWAKVNGTYFHYTTIDATGGGSGLFTYLIGVADAGQYGQLLVNIEPGDVLTLSDHVYGVPASGAGSIQVAQAKDQDVVLFVQDDDASAQTALAALEGGDGIHETVIADDEFDIAGATERAAAELAAFSGAIESITYDTRNPITRVGRTITVNLPSPTSVADAFVISTVTIRGFDQLTPRTSHDPTKFPMRHVNATPVRVGGVLDQLASGEDSI
jgi:hypothetical protein